MIEGASPLAFRQQQEAKGAMGVVMPGLKGACSAESSYGLARSAEGVQRHRAIVMGGRIVRFGSDHFVEKGDRGYVLALSGNKGAEIMSGDCVSGRNDQRGPIGRLCLRQPAGLVMRDRCCDKFSKFSVCRERHGSCINCG